jgi:hypothetical protein
MSIDFGSAIGKLVAAFAAQELTANKTAILSYIDAENPIAVDALKAALEKAEPGGFKMALIAGTLNEIFDGLDNEEKTAVPTAAAELIDFAITKLTALAS